MFDIAGSELLLLIALALIFVAPKDIPKMMRALGALVRKARMVARDFQTSIEELANENDIADLKKEAEDIKKQAGDIKKEVSDTIKSPLDGQNKASDRQKKGSGGKKSAKGGSK